MFIIYLLAVIVFTIYIWARCTKTADKYEKEIKDLMDDDNLFI